jgi:hypothetical protein
MNDLLKPLPRGIEPPPGVRRDLVARMRREGLLRRSNPWRSMVAAAALIVVGFSLGWLAGRGAPPHGRVASSQVIFLLYGTPSDPAQDAVAEYSAWARRLASEGRSVHGEKLADGSVTVGGPAPSSVPGGFFTIGAATLDEARAIAAAHPHVRRGGIIVVRAIDPTP